jgi:hypothetical protein
MSTTSRKRRQYDKGSWNSLAAFQSREHRLLIERRPDSPRTKPSLARLAWGDREPEQDEETA